MGTFLGGGKDGAVVRALASRALKRAGGAI